MGQFAPVWEQEENILDEPAAMRRFNDVVVVILSGLIGGLETASSDLRGQVVIEIASL